MRSLNSRRRSDLHPSTIEPLESRRLLAASLGVFGGTVTFGSLTNSGGTVSGGSVFTDRHHAVLNVGQANENGLVSGTFRIDNVGRFQFTGTSNNGLISLVFTGAAGSGTLSAKITDGSATQLRGEIFNNFGGTNQFAVVRMNQSSANSSTGAAALLPTVANNANSLANAVATGSQIDVTGTYSGTVHFTGQSLPGKSRAHAVLHVTGQDDSGRISGTLRIDRVGRFQFSGAYTTTGGLDIVFANGASSGTILVKINRDDVLTVGGSGGSVSGKIFAHIGSADAHGSVRFNADGSTLANNIVNANNPIAGSLIPVLPNTIGNTGGFTNNGTINNGTTNTGTTTGTGTSTGGNIDTGGLVDSTNTGVGGTGPGVSDGVDTGVNTGAGSGTGSGTGTNISNPVGIDFGVGSGTGAAIDLMNGISTTSPFSSSIIG